MNMGIDLLLQMPSSREEADVQWFSEMKNLMKAIQLIIKKIHVVIHKNSAF